MTERRLTVTHPLGLHLRPAKDLCKIAMEYESKITIRFRSREFNAKSLLSVLSACVQQSDELILECSGSDEDAAAEAISSFIEHGMDETDR